MTSLRSLATYGALGPITGLFAIRLVSCLRARRYWMAGWYCVAIVEAWLVLGLAERVLLMRIHHV